MKSAIVTANGMNWNWNMISNDQKIATLIFENNTLKARLAAAITEIEAYKADFILAEEKYKNEIKSLQRDLLRCKRQLKASAEDLAEERNLRRGVLV